MMPVLAFLVGALAAAYAVWSLIDKACSESLAENMALAALALAGVIVVLQTMTVGLHASGLTFLAVALAAYAAAHVWSTK